MAIHARAQYRWDGRKFPSNGAREDEERLNHLLRVARARNAAARSPDRPALDEWPIAGDAFVWHPHVAEGQNASRDRRMIMQAKSRRTRLTRSLAWLLLMVMPGIACALFGPEMVSVVSNELPGLDGADIAERIRGRLGE